MIRKKFKIIYEVLETGEIKTVEVITKDRYDAQNVIEESFNKGILKKIKINKIIESVKI